MIPRFLLPTVLLTGSILPTFSAQAQQKQPLNVADPAIVAESERAIVRSQEDLVKAQSLMKQASAAPSDQEAFEYASKSISMAPTGTASAKIRGSLVDSYTSIALRFAQTLIDRGDFTDKNAKDSQIHDSKGNLLSAEGVLKSILSTNPGNVRATQMLSNMEQPGTYNKTITPENSAQRDYVSRHINDAEKYRQSGRYALALRKYEEALALDPYNSIARKGMEAIHNADIKYADEAYNETRSEMLWKVERAWERPPRKSKLGRTTESLGRQQTSSTDQIVDKLKSIVIDKIDLNDTPIDEAVVFLRQKSKQQDKEQKGVNINYNNKAHSDPLTGSQASTPPPPGSPAFSLPQTASSPTTQPTEPHVTLSLKNVPLYVALDYIAKLSNMKLKIESSGVSIVPLSEPTSSMETKVYKVPPTFIPDKSLDASGSFPQPGSSGLPDPNKARLAQRMDAREFLLQQGVEFPDGATASYRAQGSQLIVHNTRDNIDVIDSLVDAAAVGAPSQVDIETKFLEINQNNIQELGFDWLLGPFSIGGGVYGTGGGDGTNVSSANYPFGNPMAGGGIMNPVGGLRSGDQAITGNSIDSLLAGQIGVSTAPAPGIFSIAGVFSEPQFQLVIRALNQKKGIDLMSAPKVTTKSGAKATIKIVDEFIYPRTYQPPQIPQTTSNTSGAPPSITPAFPSDFTKQDLGVTLDAQPTIGPDGVTIDLELNPRVVDFDGFINYGSPINSVGYVRTAGSGFTTWTPIVQTLTTNTINQPVFSTREVNTRVTVWDGYTVALGGLIREDIQKAQDKVPFLGDIPLAGRLFRSEADQKVKKNLMIFVTPRIRDADGQLRKDEVEEPDMEKPLPPISDLPGPTLSSGASRGK